MASTNKTTNYELSQYIGSDKPTYLGDYNSDMQKIDTQMKANSTASSIAKETADIAIENASTAQETADSANNLATTANNTATSALSKATINENEIVNLKGDILYNGDSINEIELLASVENYSFIEIYFKQNQNYYNSIKIDNPNNKSVLLMISTPDFSVSQMFHQIRGIKIINNAITNVENCIGQIKIKNGVAPSFDTTNNIRITKVIGYKN